MKEERISVLEDRVKENINQNDSLRQVFTTSKIGKTDLQVTSLSITTR